ncbi:MAG: hypothetical protein KAI18_04675 [Candidatus Aenigmarchaeota archaeon]|nr:hypothetical protein [Candidatus Aenigmarchaeota archaeon]
MVFSIFNKLKTKEDKTKNSIIKGMVRINPITNAMNKHLENLQNLKGKKVTIEVKSLYDQVSNQLIINEYISGRVLYVDNYGIMLADTARKKYVNNKFQGQMHTPSPRCLVYHKIINYIYIDDPIPVFTNKKDKV